MPPDIQSILAKVAGQVGAGPDQQDAAAGYTPDAGAAPSTDIGGGDINLNSVPLSEAEIGEWFKRIERSIARRKVEEERWKILLDAYTPKVTKMGDSEEITVPIHFRNVHTKIGQMFVERPEVRLTPKGPMLDVVMLPDPTSMTGFRTASPEEIVPIRAAVLNEFMGRGQDKINGTRLMDEMLIDILAWAGLGCCKVGYKATIKKIQKPRMVPAPPPMPQMPVEGSPLILQPGEQPLPPNANVPPQLVPAIGPDGKPIMDIVPVPVHKRISADRFSPMKLLLDDQLTSTRYNDKSRWVGHEFFMDKAAALRDLGLTEDDIKAVAEDDRVYKPEGDGKQDASKDLVHGYEIFYYASFFTDEVHPLAVNQLILIDGLKVRAAVSRPSPDQEFDENGRITQDSMLGLPIKVITNRDFPDSPYPRADNAFIHTLTKELNTFRRQSSQRRDAAIGKYLFDTGAFDKTDLELMKNGPVGAFIGVAEGALAAGSDKVWSSTAQVHATADDYRTQAQYKQDIDETMGISANQAGTETDTVRSATETATTAQASAGRIKKEQNRIMEGYLEVVEAVDSLVVRYMDQGDYVSMVGQDGVRRLIQWNNQMIAGRHSYDIEPDSQMALDAAISGQQDMAFYNMVAKDPLVNRIPILRHMFIKRGYDPFKCIADPTTQVEQPAYGDAASKHTAENSGGKPNAPGASNRDERTNKPPEGGQ